MEKSRIEKIRNYLNQAELEGIFISSYENRRYFSGFTGSNGYLIITGSDLILITDPRYSEQAEIEAPLYKVYTHGLNPYEVIIEAFNNINIKKIGFEGNKTSWSQFNSLNTILSEAVWHPVDDELIHLRSIKDGLEIENIKEAIKIAERTLDKVCRVIKPGISEKDIAVELEYIMAREGSEGPTFGTIVASGKRSSLPHGTPTNKIIENGDMIVIDFGAKYKGYMSDITRTIWVGGPDDRLVEIFNIVLESQERAIEAIKPGIKCKDVDSAHRKVFIDNGVEKYSLRGLGHGIGLEIHENPRVVMNNENIIRENMIFTVEPGIYLPNYGGVRIEDDVLVKEDGYQVLTSYPRFIQV